MATLIRPYDFILEPDSLFDADPDRLRPFRVVYPADPARAFVVEEGTLQLRPNEAARAPLNDPRGSLGGLAPAGGVAVWGDTIFFADPARHRVLTWRLCDGPPRPLPAVAARPWPPPPLDPVACDTTAPPPPRGRELALPTGLTISARHDLVVADSALRRLLLFALPGFVLRRVIALPARGAGEAITAGCDDELWQPVDVAAGPRGRLYVLDAGGFVWQLDSQGRPEPNYVGALPAGVVPRRVAVDGDGRAYVLAAESDAAGAALAVFALDRFGRLIMTGEPPAPLRLTAVDQSPEPGAPPLSALLGPPPLALDGRELILTAGREQIRTGLLVGDSGRLVLAGLTDTPYAIYVPPLLTFKQEETLIVELDSRHFGNAWHRMVIERAEIDRTGIQLYSLTGDQPRLDWRAGLPAGGEGWTVSPVNATEWLVQSPPGQFLYLGLRLVGPGDRTPRLERVYVYRERQSSLSLLPATFQADPAGRSVLDRLLSLFDTIYAELEVTIDEFAFLLDANSAHPEFVESFLPWLSSWFGLVLEQTWSEEQKRAFLREVMWLYRRRGTPAGIARLVELHTGARPRVIEHYATWRKRVADTGEPPEVGQAFAEQQERLRAWLNAPGIESFDDPALKEAEPQHHFSIWLPAYTLTDDDRLEALHRLLLAYIPAHTHYTLRRLPQRGFRLPYARDGVWTPGIIVGVDTVLGSLPDWRVSPGVEPERRLGIGTLLPAAAGPVGVFQLGSGPLRRPPRRRPVCSSCRKHQEG